MNELNIIKRGNAAYIDSREVAEYIGKRHDHLLRDIGKYREIIARARLPKVGESDFFIESSYYNAQNKAQPCYLISRRGADVIANKLIGEKGVLFTAAYVTRFHELEQQERERQIAEQNKPRLSEFNSAVRNVLDGMGYACASPERVMDFLRGVYNPLGIEVAADGDEYGYYSATDIARNIGIYSFSGRPHGHAVAAIISKLNIPARHIIVVPYGLVSVFVKYDSAVIIAVSEWLAKNGYPNDIAYCGFEYHVWYDKQMSLFDDDEDGGSDEYIAFNDDDGGDIYEWTADELDELCAEFDSNCDNCPGRNVCCDVV
jgi:Rha family phage regulatory protein